MNPRQRRIRRQRRKERVRDAEAAREEVAAFNRKAARLLNQQQRKAGLIPTAPPTKRELDRLVPSSADTSAAMHELRIASQIEEGKAAFARLATRESKR